MNLRSRLLIMGCIALVLQIFALGAFYYYFINPVMSNLEKSLVEKNLHRGLELLQRELFHLTHTTQMLAQDPLITQLLNEPSKQLLPNDILQRKMLRQEINIIYVLDNDHKVIWDSSLDLSTERPFPKQPLLTNIWEKRPGFLDHNSVLSLYAGILNSNLGPMFIVSAPISSATNNKVEGTLIVGELITQDVLHMIQSLTYTDVKLWPLGGTTLTPNQISIIQRLRQGDSDFIVDDSGDLHRGYMSMQDINQQPNFLISATQSLEITKRLEFGFSEMIGLFIVLQIVLFLAFYWLVRRTLLYPARTLIKQLNQSRIDWRPLQVDTKPWNEMGMLANAVSNVIIRLHDKISQETNMAYREGCYQTRHLLFKEIEDTIKPVIDNIEIAEKKLSNLPTNDLEWIIAESKTGQYSAARFAEYTTKLQNVNDKLRHYQKEARHRLYDIYSKTLRNLAAIRAQSRSLDAIREFTQIRADDDKENTKSKSYTSKL